MTKLISFDESGNTGPDLLNEVQSVFCLSSSDISTEDAQSLLSTVWTNQTKEAKFTQLNRSKSGRNRIINFVKAASNLQAQFATSLVHKEFMVTTKIVDLLVESVFHKDGYDLYKDGANIAMSNMLFYCMPTFCGRELTRLLYEKFIRLIRFQDSAAIEDFYRHLRCMLDASKQDFAPALAPIIVSQEIIYDILTHNNALSLDPSIPTFYQHCAFWGDKLGESFDVLHDESRSLSQSKELLEKFMAKDIPHQIVGHDRRKYGFPLKASGVHLGNSIDDARLQVVDIMSGSTAYLTKSLANGSLDDFATSLQETGIEEYVIHTIWPSQEVDPEKLGTKGDYGVDALDYIVEHLGGNS